MELWKSFPSIVLFLSEESPIKGPALDLILHLLPLKWRSWKFTLQKCSKSLKIFLFFFVRNIYSSTYQCHFWGKPDFYVCISIYFLFILCAFVFSAQEFQSNWLATDTGISLCYESILWQPGDRRMC